MALLFLTNGALFANLLPRYPEIKSSLGLTNSAFGLAVAAFPLGALVAGLAAGVLIRRFRSSRVAVASTIVLGLGVVAAGVASSWTGLAGVLFLAGSMDAITDVAQNSHGLRVQRAYGRSILNSFHGLWSIGAALGGLMGGAAAGLGVPIGMHLAISLVLFSAVVLGAYRFLLPGAEPVEPVESVRDVGGSVGSRLTFLTVAVLAALVVIVCANAVVEDSGASWSALYLSDKLSAAATVAALGFVALTGAQFVGRMLGDRLVDRFGQRAMARVGGAFVAGGMGIALALPSIPGTIAGFAAAGWGIATLVPAALDAADRLPGLKPGAGLTLVAWLMRLGFLGAPPLVGAIADASSLRGGLLVVPISGVLVVLLAGVLAKGGTTSPSSSRVRTARAGRRRLGRSRGTSRRRAGDAGARTRRGPLRGGRRCR